MVPPTTDEYRRCQKNRCTRSEGNGSTFEQFLEFVPDALLDNLDETLALRGRATLQQLRRQIGQQPDRQADHVGDAALDPLDQGRAKRLDRVPARPSPPLLKPHVALDLRLIELLEDTGLSL